MNNDGLVDLFIAKGNVAQMPDFAMRDPDNLLLQTPEGKFVETGEAAGIANNGTSRGAALVDFNLDGLLDLVVVNRWTGAQIWRNASAESGNWVEFRIKQAQPNGGAIGAWLELKQGNAVLRRELTIGGGHAGGQAGWRHFGLGSDQPVTAVAIWPDGTRSEWTGLAANAFYVLERDNAAARFTPDR